MLDEPSWLQDDDDVKSNTTANTNNGSSTVTSGMASPKAPAGPKPVTPSRKQQLAKNAQLEEDGLDFLKSEVADSAQVVKETKNGVLIVDDELATPDAMAATVGAAPKPKTNAPVHFLKRMREAEEKRVQRMEKIATGERDAERKERANESLNSTLNGTLGGKPKGLGAKKNSGDNPLNKTMNSTFSPNSTMGGTSAGSLGADGGIVETDTVDLSVIPELSDDDKNDYAASIAMYGLFAIRKLRSNRYQHRVDALHIIRDDIIEKKHLQQEKELDAYEVVESDDEDEFGVKKQRSPAEQAARDKAKKAREEKASLSTHSEVQLTISTSNESEPLIPMVEVLSVALKDNLFHVIVAACELIEGVMENYPFLDKCFVDEHLKTTITALITRLKDSNNRSKEAVTSTLLNLASHPNIGPSTVVKLVAKSVPMPAGADSTEAMPAPSARDDFKYTIAKIDLCHSILQAKPRHISALSDDCLRIATHGLSSANPQARKRAANFFGFIRTECGAEGIKKYLSTISPATIKMLKQEIGIDDGATFSASASATVTAAKFLNAMSIDDDKGTKEENEDIAAFDADGDALTEDQEALADYLFSQFPEVKSFQLLFSSRWNLRERLLLRLFTVLEDRSLNLGGAGSGGGIIAKLTASNIQMNQSLGGASNADSSAAAGAGPHSSLSGKPPVPKRFMQKDDSDSDGDDSKASKPGGAVRARLTSPTAVKSLRSNGSLSEAVGNSSVSVDSSQSYINSAQLGAIVGICEKSFTDSVPSVAAAAVKLLKIALQGYKAEDHNGITTPPPSTPIDGIRSGTANGARLASASSNRTGASTTSVVVRDDIPSALMMIVPRLVTLSTGNLTAEGSLEALTLIASLPFITLHGALKTILAMDKVENVSKASVKAICSRLDACSHLLVTVPNDRNIDICRLVIFATAAFQHREPKARTSGATLVLEVYKRVGERIQPHLEHIRGAVADDLRAKMAKITLREKQQTGASAKVRLAVFGTTGVLAGAAAASPPIPAPPSGPSPNRNFHKPGGTTSPIPKADEVKADMAQGKNRKGNLVFS